MIAHCSVAKCSSRSLALTKEPGAAVQASVGPFALLLISCVSVQVCPAASWRRKRRRSSSTPPAPPAGRPSRGDAAPPSRPSPPAAACRAAPGEGAEASARRRSGAVYCFILNANSLPCPASPPPAPPSASQSAARGNPPWSGGTRWTTRAS